jgi:dihydroxyacid dehydratase/phosphogluconate dehydratase
VFLTGNLAPDGSLIKATSIDPSLINNGVYDFVGKARVFTTEAAAIQAIKGKGEKAVVPGNVIVLAGCGPMGTGMEETYQLTAALKHLPSGKQIPLITDARFSGVSTGVCIGHVGPEGLAGGPIGKLLDDDIISIRVDCQAIAGSVNLIGHGTEIREATWGTRELARRPLRSDLREATYLPDDTRLWAALQTLGGGTWGGCVYDVEEILAKLKRHPNC